MSDASREQAKWIQEKEKVILEYSQQNKELSSAVAGRGFLVIPGFMYDVHNDLERGIKMKLSDVNFAILSDSIERELKQLGVDYDLAYKNASIVWEMTKQDLLGQWEQEHADIKRGMEFTEEALLRLNVAVQARNSILMTQKIAIELQAEDLRRQLAEKSADSSSYEVALAQQKVLTATKKLDLIPILQQIVQAETELIGEKNALLASKNTLITMTGGLLQYEAMLAQAKLEHVAATEDLIVAQNAVVVLEQALVALKLTAIPSMTALIDAKTSVVDSKDELTTAKEELVAAQATVETYKERVLNAKANLVAAEYTVFPYEQALNTEMGKIAARKLSLVPIYAEIVGQLSLLAVALTRQSSDLASMAAERVSQAQYKVQKNISRMARAMTMVEVDGLLNEIEMIRLEMATLRDKGETAALKQEAEDIRAMADKEKSVLDTINSEGRSNNQQVIATKTTSVGLDSTSKIEASKKTANSDSQTHAYVSIYQRQTLQEETEFKIQTEVTATLSHLLSM